jgi:hypothetical protein
MPEFDGTMGEVGEPKAVGVGPAGVVGKAERPFCVSDVDPRLSRARRGTMGELVMGEILEPACDAF